MIDYISLTFSAECTTTKVTWPFALVQLYATWNIKHTLHIANIRIRNISTWTWRICFWVYTHPERHLLYANLPTRDMQANADQAAKRNLVWFVEWCC